MREYSGPSTSVEARPPACRRAAGLGLLLLFHLILGCSAPDRTANVPLADGARNGSYDLAALNASSGRADLLILVALSGGGMRSAAFAHGVLRGMRHVPIPGGQAAASNLLAEIDQLSGVSGGSFPAAHYALYGEKSFATFPADFLYRDIADYVWGSYVLPWHWRGLLSPLAGTNDRMAEVYDGLLFHGATFSDLISRGRPRLSINATDLATGVAFPFLPRTFDVICSDFARFPIAQAVAASNGFPVLFTPITLRNYRGAGCDLPMPRMDVVPAVASSDEARRLREIVRTMADSVRTPWLHLVDGGVADNLAMRAMHNFTLLGGTEDASFAERSLPVRRILLISVDGQSSTDPAISLQRHVGGLAQIFDAVSGAQIDNYNAETMAATSQELQRAVQRQRARRCGVARRLEGRACDDVRGLVTRISLSDIQDVAHRNALRRIPTGLSLPRSEIGMLIAAGEAVVRHNRMILEFLAQ